MVSVGGQGRRRPLGTQRSAVLWKIAKKKERTESSSRGRYLEQTGTTLSLVLSALGHSTKGRCGR